MHQQSAPHPQAAPQRLTLLGATGSIGTSTLKLLDAHPNRFVLEAVTAMDNAEKLADLAKHYGARCAVIGNDARYEELKTLLAGTGIEAAAGEDALAEAAQRPADIVVSAIVGAAGLKPTLAAIQQGVRVALANKECLVCAGELMLAEVHKHGATLLPVDSEHNAIFQVFDFERPETVDSIILTASGGPFRTLTAQDMQHVTPKQALKHPNWDMGAKITIDSATMMNKGLELIEAYYLFPVQDDQIEIIVHPESIIHSMVRYVDGSVLAQMGQPDMSIPIAYALSWPDRVATPTPKLDFNQISSLNFEPADYKRFPCLSIARDALKARGIAPAVMNAANEIAVDAFLNERIAYIDIPKLVARSVDSMGVHGVTSIGDVLDADVRARELATRMLSDYD